MATNFTRSGSASLSPGNLRAVGGHLNYWLKTLYLDPANAYRLHLNLEDLYVNHDYPRFYGFSLRCLSSLPRPSGRGRKSIVKQKNNNTSHQANLYPGYVAFEG